jgi:starch synthase
MKIAICASEVFPFAKTGGLADVAGALPLALEELRQEVIIIMPKYKQTSEGEWRLSRLASGDYCTTLGRKIKVYFIKNDKYFARNGLYGEKSGDYPDNLERFAFFCRQALELLKEVGFMADIIHCHDWQSCLVPVYLKTLYQSDTFYSQMKTLLTVHNIGYQGIFAKEEFPKLALDWSLFNMEALEFYNQVNILKGGMVFADAINTVSKTYSEEIQRKEFAFGLEGILTRKKNALYGILNGLEYSVWNPREDKLILKAYSEKNLQDKYKNKEDLQKICNLSLENLPLLGIVSRLAEQKGFDILAEAIDEICNLKLQLVILGTGDLKYHLLLEEIRKKYPKTCSVHFKFDETLAHKIYAGSDIFLMPSKYEPCGLGQMISLKYATIPLVFKTGGLADTVSSKNGFVFDIYGREELLKTVKKAIVAYKDREKWLLLMRRAMACNFSWTESAKQYIALYQNLKR